MFRLLNHKKVSKCISSLMLFAILFNNVIFPSKAFALTSGPSQPEFSSFDSAGSSEMVNLFTGDFSYNIPLMDVDGYPLNIAYHASPSMDQEASWVGLGWNINSGSTNRGMRGLPDDFNGEEIKREINIEDYKAWGVAIGAGTEVVGEDFASFALSAGMGVTKSNYKGVGLEFFFEPTMSANIVGKNAGGSLTAGLGIKASTTDGTDIYPQLGISGQYHSNNATASIGLNIGANYNSREGVKSVNYGVTATASKGKYGESRGSSSTRNSGIGMGVGTSASIPSSSQGFMPQMQNSMKSQSYSLDFKLGGDACVVAAFGYVKGYYAQNGLKSKNISLPGFGYMNAQNSDRESLLDFNREKDGMMYPETPNMPITNHTYDMFYATGQGMEMSFRPHRNDIGVVFDNPTTESSFALGTSAELMFTTDVNIGANVNTHWSNGKSGRWDDGNDMLARANFVAANANADYEPAYLKAAGEKTADDATFLSMIKDDEAVRVKLEQLSTEEWRATENIEDNALAWQTISNSATKSKRAVRNNLISYLNADEARYAAINKNILSYHAIDPNSFSPTNFGLISTTTSTDRLSYAGSRGNQISEVMVTKPNGSRYVYGLPVYNKDQQEVMFNISGSGTTHSGTSDGLIKYSTGDNSIGNTKGLDHFYEKNTIPPYAHSYLLTALLSSDYVDRTGDGPSEDDYGNYTRFNYSYAGDYKWRVPFLYKTATFNEGFLSDKTDDKASYIYGEKDLWYAHSIESKNYVAYFVLNDQSSAQRKDGFGVSSDAGNLAGNTIGAQQQSYLKEIRLYAKKDIAINGIANTKPIKIVHFEYDYSLCPGVPNNANFSSTNNNGKLTLKKVYFTYGNSSKGALTPYVFDYCGGNYSNHAYNPVYNPSSIDRWGVFKPNTGTANDNNLDFPYAEQDKATADLNAAAWNLTNIKTPAGSNITVTYEADDYAYVQNKNATQMYKTLGAAAAPNVTPGSVLYGSDYLFVDLSSSKGDGVLTTDVNAIDDIKNKYFKDLTKIYIKACVDLGNNKYEFVPLYADVEQVIADPGSVYTYGPDTYYNAIIKLKKVGINDAATGDMINPITKAAFQLGRVYLPGIVFPGSQTSGTNESIIKGLVTLVRDMSSLFSGINKALYRRNVAKNFDFHRSIVKLYTAAGKKMGGGSRVKQIEISDNWNVMSGHATSTYGQTYSYTTTGEDGSEISSGVASYEPLHGGDENTMRQPVEFSIKRVMAPNDEYFQEEPIGETLFPDPLVGYSKVTVKNLDHTAQNITKHATGKTEYEFYTAKDFPVIVSRTMLDKEPVKPKLIKSLLNFGSTSKLYMSQGYVVETNDMHGKPKGQKNYAEGVADAYSGITYYYKTKAGSTSALDNTVSVIDKTNSISPKVIGQTTDMITDSRMATSDVYGAGVAVNINLASCSLYAPLVFVWPSFSHEKREYYGIGTTKLINQYGLVDYAEAFDNHSIVHTNNLLYDEETGDVVLTSTQNNYDAPVYNLNYPAYWAYDRMGHGYKNIGIQVIGTGNLNLTTSEVTGTFFVPGDEVLVTETMAPNPNIYTNTWVAYDAVHSKKYLIKADGSVFGLTTTNLNHVFLKVTRSGRRNLQSMPMSSLVSLGTPIVSNQININSTTTKVLNSTAVEYSENWQKPVGQTINILSSCTTQISTFGNYAINLWNSLFANTSFKSYMNVNYINVTNPTAYWPSSGGAVAYTGSSNTFYSSQMQSVLMADPFFMSHYYNIPGKSLNFNISKTTDIPNSSTDRDILSLTLFDPAMGFGYDVGIFTIQVLHPYSNGVPNTFNKINSISNWNYGYDLCCSGTHVACGLDASLATLQALGYGAYIIQLDCNDGVPSLQFKALMPTINYNSTVGRPAWPKLVDQIVIPANNAKCGTDFGDHINPYVENLRGNWHTKYDYSYLVNRTSGSIKTTGDYTSFRPFYEYTSSNWLPIYNPSRTGFTSYSSTPYENWVRNNEVQLIDQNGGMLQLNDALNRRSATLYGYRKMLPVARASNAYYGEIGFDGFEDYDYLTGDCSAMSSISPGGFFEHFNYYNYKTQRNYYTAHTGKYSMSVAASTSSDISSIKMSRQLTNPSPTGGADDVPYTFKGTDNHGLFGPLYNISKKYVLSVWVKKLEGLFGLSSPQVSDYADALVAITVGTPLTTSLKKSPIINGWQKLEYEFTIPNISSSSPTSIDIELVNTSTSNVYVFDDLRIHPYNASMKTMVYDPFSLRLMAEHDDRNFATFYEYDEEGTLVRIKKETEKGIYTLKETRSGLRKQ